MNNEKELRVALERLLAERETKVADLAQLDSAIEGLRKILGEPASYGEIQGVGKDAVPPSIKELGRQSRQPFIRPDQFFGLSHTAATESYLKMVGYAVHLDQILDVLTKGGITIGGSDPKKNLYTELIRATKKFVLVSPYTFGLREFYPNLPKKSRKEATKKSRPKKRGKAKSRMAQVKKKLVPKPQSDETSTGE